MLIQLLERSASFNGVTLKTRSKELIRFVGYLGWRFHSLGTSDWVGIEEMRGVVGSAEPKQFQRYLDKLQESGLAVVEYRHKTKGPWRLVEKVKQVSFDLAADELARWFPAPPSLHHQSASPAGNYQELFDFVELCAKADANFYEGNLADEGECSSLNILSNGHSLNLPPNLSILLHLKITRTCMRASRYEEAAANLKQAEGIAARHPAPHSELNYRIKLVKAKLLFDQGKTPQSRALLDSIPIQECHDSHTIVGYHNLMGIHLKRKLRLAIEGEKSCTEEWAREIVTRGSNHLQHAIAMALSINDYYQVEASCFNLGDLLIFAYRHVPQLREATFVEDGLRWLALCESVCNKLGVGGESVWALYVMLKTVVMEDLSLDYLKSLTGNLFSRFTSFEAAAEDIYKEAQRLGNRPEMADAQALLHCLAMKRGDTAEAREHALAALDLFSELKRNDMIRPLKKLISQLEAGKKGKPKGAT